MGPDRRLPSAQQTPGFPVELIGTGELHAAFLNESRTRGRVQRSAQEIRAEAALISLLAWERP